MLTVVEDLLFCTSAVNFVRGCFHQARMSQTAVLCPLAFIHASVRFVSLVLVSMKVVVCTAFHLPSRFLFVLIPTHDHPSPFDCSVDGIETFGSATVPTRYEPTHNRRMCAHVVANSAPKRR